MSTIGGPGGIGGPKGPQGTPGADGPDGPSDIDGRGTPTAVSGPEGGRGSIDDVAGEAAIAQAPAAPAAGDLEALAAEVAAGRLTPHEAIDRLVEATAGPGLDATERAELRELLSDLVTNDPHLGGLANRI